MAVGAELIAVTTNVNALNAAIKAASPLNNNSLAKLGSAILAANAANASVDAAILLTDAKINQSGVYGIAGAGFAPVLAATLLAQKIALQNEAILMIEKAAIGRIVVNFAQATG